MCGIAAILDFERGPDESLLRAMCHVIRHRGPDSQGIHLSGPAGLGIQRLAIIDVAHGDQPIFNEDGSVAVVMNGEIYNHDELRESLRARGHRFTTHADTEVLVHLYEEFGDALVHRLRGMFAFALWDGTRQRLLCARDRAGKKPLFYAHAGGRCILASEVRALLEDPTLSRELDPEAIDAFLTLQYVPHPLSVFASVAKLPPASTLTIDSEGAEVRTYWDLDYTTRPCGSEAERAEQLRAHLWDATRVRLMSEVPLGAFLSGGIDSSAVVAAMADQMGTPVKTFSIGFSEAEWDETAHARQVAERFGTEHHEFRVEPEALRILPRLSRHYGEPFADASAIPSFYLAELTSSHVTVALNGDGGDESFAGYGRYARADLLRRVDAIPASLRRAFAQATMLLKPGDGERSFVRRAQRAASIMATDVCGRYLTSLTSFPADLRHELYSESFRAEVGACRGEAFVEGAWHASQAPSLVERLIDVDRRTYLPGDLLVKMDIATMAHSVEGRSPFLDHHFMEWAAGLPAEDKFAAGGGKRLLKLALRPWLPPEILDRPKMGFGVPLARWFRTELRELPGELLLDPGARVRQYLRTEVIERLICEHQHAVADHSVRLWSLIQLESWHREVLEMPAALWRVA